MNKLMIGMVLAAMAALSLGAWCAETNVVPAVAAESAADEFMTRTFVLKYAKASEVADSLNRLCEKLKLTEVAVAFPESHLVAVAGAKNAFLSREYLDGTKKEPGDNTKEELEEKLDRARSILG